MNYSIEFRPAASRALAGLPRLIARRITAQIEALASDPLPHGSVKLKGTDWYRIRIGNYRAVYDVQHDKLVVIVIRVGHRRDIYRGLST